MSCRASTCIVDVWQLSPRLRHGLVEAGLHSQGEGHVRAAHVPTVAAQTEHTPAALQAAHPPAVVNTEHGVVHTGDESTDNEAQSPAQSTSPLVPVARKRPRLEVPPPQRRSHRSAQGAKDSNVTALAIADALRPRDNALRDRALETVECVILHVASELGEPVPPVLEEAARVLVGMDGLGSAASRMVCRAVSMWSQRVAGLVQGSTVDDATLSTVSMDNVHLLVQRLESVFKLGYVASPS